MRKLNYEKLKKSALTDLEGLKAAFIKYLMEKLDYFEGEAKYVANTDMNDPYSAPYIVQDYDGNIVLDGEEYEVRKCHTDFCMCGMFHYADKTPFQFYMFILKSDLSDNTVGSYMKARKLYKL